MRVAMVSEHASPLAVLGGVDAGGQNVHVAALAEGMARHGADVVVHTRRGGAISAVAGAVSPVPAGQRPDCHPSPGSQRADRRGQRLVPRRLSQ